MWWSSLEQYFNFVLLQLSLTSSSSIWGLEFRSDLFCHTKPSLRNPQKNQSSSASAAVGFHSSHDHFWSLCILAADLYWLNPVLVYLPCVAWLSTTFPCWTILLFFLRWILFGLEIDSIVWVYGYSHSQERVATNPSFRFLIGVAILPYLLTSPRQSSSSKNFIQKWTSKFNACGRSRVRSCHQQPGMDLSWSLLCSVVFRQRETSALSLVK